MTTPDVHERVYALHGIPIKLRCGSELLAQPLNHLLGEFLLPESHRGVSGAIDGWIKVYEESEVVRRLPASAARLTPPGELTEIYQHDELYWLIDDRWGMAEINLLKGQWRSWILPQPTIEPYRCMEMTVLWPLTQLLRGKGLVLVPGASAVRDGWGMLILSPISIEPELRALVRAGFHVVGQRWTALREESGGVAMLRLPGMVESSSDTRPSPRASRASMEWVDLTSEFYGSSAAHANCDTVMLIERTRRPVAHLKSLPRTNAMVALRRSWPIAPLHAQRRLTQLHARMARHCRVFEARLSRNASDFLRVADDARYNRVPAVEPTLHVRSASRRVVA